MWAVAAQPRTGLTPTIPTPSAGSGTAGADVTSNLLLRVGTRGAGGEALHGGGDARQVYLAEVGQHVPSQVERSRANRPWASKRLTIRDMPLSESAQAEARSLILRLRPGASDKCISAVYALSDMLCPASKSASRARGTVRAARDHARRNASSPALSGTAAGLWPALAMESTLLA